MSIPRREQMSPDTRTVDPNQPFLDTPVPGSRVDADARPVGETQSSNGQGVLGEKAASRRRRRTSAPPARP
jgi:hypothetical protein